MVQESSQELLKCYHTKDMVEGGQTVPVGTLVWAKMSGSIYWPGIIADLEDKPGKLNSKNSVPLSSKWNYCGLRLRLPS